MSKTSSSSSSMVVKDVVHKLQLCLLEGINSETQLLVAGSLLSKSDYHDVVTERSIAQMCGYPLCPNSLPSPSPSEPPKKGRYRISLKEHKVYDLLETRMFCSTKCVVDSRAYAGSLQDDRSLALDTAKIDKVVRLFEGLNLKAEEGLGENGDLGLRNLSIKEKEDGSVGGGVVSMEEWVGPSNAIEGYVPQHDRSSKNSQGSKLKDSKLKREEECIFNEMNFMSTIITQDNGYSISKEPSGQNKEIPSSISKDLRKQMNHKGTNHRLTISAAPSTNAQSISETKLKESNDEESGDVTNYKPRRPEVPSSTCQSGAAVNVMERVRTPVCDKEAQPSSSGLKSSLKSSGAIKTNCSVTWADEKKMNGKGTNDGLTISAAPSSNAQNMPETKLKGSNDEESDDITNYKPRRPEVPSSTCQSGVDVNVMERVRTPVCDKEAEPSSSRLKSSLKSSGAIKTNCSVTWADEKTDDAHNQTLSKFSEMENEKEISEGFGITDKRTDDADHAFRLASAEACAVALSQAAEDVASGESDVLDAVSEAGLLILPPPLDDNEVISEEIADAIDPEPARLKWPKRTGIVESDFFDSEDSWFDSPPEEFTLDLSPFATMFMSLFAWISSSTLAYVYGCDDGSNEEYASINGREYPQKIVLTDGRSSEIKQTLAGCLARALPGLVYDLRLPTPISTIEYGMGCLLETMSFLDPLPPLRTKQWQVFVLLFVDALSVCRIPAIAPYMTNRRRFFQKVFDDAQISIEEYEVLKDLILPLGRVPQLAMQSGG